MASTYTTGFGIEKIGSGEQDGTWGTTTNHNLDIIDRIASYKAVAITTNADTATLTVREASPGSGTENLQDGMYRVIKFTGALDSNCTVTIAPNTAPAWFIIENATTDSGSSGPYSIILSQGSGANVTVQNGKNAIVYCDGAGGGAAVIDALADLQVGTLEVTGAAAIDGALTGSSTIQGTTITATTAFVPDASDGAALGTTSLEFSDLYLADGAVAAFGNDQDVTLTHVADTGLLLNSTNQLQFGDSGTYIYQSADGVLDLVSDTEIEINATTIDVNGTTNFSGAITPAASDGAALGTTSLEWSDLYLADGGVIGFGNDQDVTLTHVADTGLLLNSTMALQFYDASQFINAPSATVLDINATDEIELNATLVDVNANVEVSGTSALGGTLTVTGASQFNSTITAGVDDTGYDVKFFGDTASRYWLWDTSADGVVQRGTLTVGVDDAGHDVKFFGDTASAYMLWDASTDDLILGGAAKLGIGTTAPDSNHSFEIKATNPEMGLISDDGGAAMINFGDASARLRGRIYYSNASEYMKFAVNGNSDRFQIGASEVVVNEDQSDIDFRVESDGNANMLFVDAGNNRVGIATASPSAPAILEVYANSTDTGGTILINQAGAGDPALQFKTAATNYVVGVDNSDSDIFKIDYGTTGVGASTGFSMNTSGHSSFHDKQVSRLNLKDYGEVTSALGSAGGARTIDLENGNNFTATVSASTVTWTFSNPTASDELCGFTLFLTNGGSQTVNWPASVDWAGGTAPTLTSSGLDILVFITTDGGTIWHGMVSSADSKSPS
jgi:hypothetical protein